MEPAQQSNPENQSVATGWTPWMSPKFTHLIVDLKRMNCISRIVAPKWDLYTHYDKNRCTNHNDKVVAQCRDCKDNALCSTCIKDHSATKCFAVEINYDFFCSDCAKNVERSHFQNGCSLARLKCKMETEELLEHVRQILRRDAIKFILGLDDFTVVTQLQQGQFNTIRKQFLNFAREQNSLSRTFKTLVPDHLYSEILDLRLKSSNLLESINNYSELLSPLAIPEIGETSQLNHIYIVDDLILTFAYPFQCYIFDHEKTLIYQNSSFKLFIRDIFNAPTSIENTCISITCDSINEFILTQKCDHFEVSYNPRVSGFVEINIKIYGIHIRNSPFTKKIYGRNYGNIATPIAVFGTKGENDGELNRPWGVCCDKNGRILVADRSNHRIQIFSMNGNFLDKFGTHGCHVGEFNLPVGIAVDNKLETIVIADKDNHRVQVFTFDGDFSHTFGSEGGEVGQLHYPWDVAVNSRHEILVADSRNRRVQLFSQFGNVLRVCNKIHSPRGVCFTSNNLAVVTDFDEHTVNILCDSTTKPLITIKQQFNRPSGIDVDREGNILVVDSKENRIQIFDVNGKFISSFGQAGSEIGQFQRPSDICLGPMAEIVVVDFENNRIQVF